MLLLVFCLNISAQNNPSSDQLIHELTQTIIPSKAKPSVHYDAPSDSSHVELRLAASSTLDKFRNDPDFNYNRDLEYGKTLWGTIKYYIAKFIRSLYDIDGSGKWLQWSWIALLAGVAVFGLIKMLGVDVSGIFFSQPPPAVDLAGTLIDENVDQDQLAAMLEKALDKKEYRLAVRLTYLIVLKRLSETGQIHWQSDKTNRSYVNEISDQTLRQPFANLTRLYEYVWYGDFDINAVHYKDIETDFNELNRRLQ